MIRFVNYQNFRKSAILVATTPIKMSGEETSLTTAWPHQCSSLLVYGMNGDADEPSHQLWSNLTCKLEVHLKVTEILS